MLEGGGERRGLEKSWIAMIVDRKSYEPVSSSSPFLPLASRESMKGKKEGSRFMRRSSIESVNFVSRINLDSPRRQKTNAGQTERERERESVERLAQENYRSVNSIAEREKISKVNNNNNESRGENFNRCRRVDFQSNLICSTLL